MKFFHVFKANMKKEYIEMKRYLPDTIVTLVVLYVIFLIMFLGLKIGWDKSTLENNIDYIIVSYVIWYISSLVIQSTAIDLGKESMKGTIEQIFLSRIGVVKIVFSKIVSITIVNLVSVFVLITLAMLTTSRWVDILNFTILPFLVLIIISMFGVSFMLAGLIILYKEIQAFLQIILVIFMGMAFTSVSVAPVLSFAPFMKGADLIRGIVTNNYSFTDIATTDYLIVIANSGVYLVLGIIFFKFCINKAIKTGVVGHY